jgi:hypothetical protein
MAFEVVEADGLHLVRSTALRARHAFSTRIGGVSESPFDRLNMGLSAGDEADRVRENRERFRAAGGFSGAIAVAHQVHGATVNELPLASGVQGDVIVTDHPGAPIGVFVADCVPILIEGPGAIAAVHAGWRGTAQRAVQAAVAALRDRYGVDPAAMVAAIGPSIRGCCYQVGDEVIAAIEDLPDRGACAEHRPDGWRLDLQEANRQLLVEAKVGRIDVSGHCTACDRDRYFSYRRDGARSGRMLAAIELS